MTYLNINLKLEELTEAVLNSDMNTLMKSLAITVFNAYMEEERQWILSIGTLKLQVPHLHGAIWSTDEHCSLKYLYHQ
ncbi:hypothetical protein [Abiotrophia sp.]|uniref:hypothetical protein n=1 Tax=Abiotrophia sp. TaxID=76631 RepID=UPI0027BAE308|nr:hypothetical protein [Abiotrophia sp.]